MKAALRRYRAGCSTTLRVRRPGRGHEAASTALAQLFDLAAGVD